MVDEADLGTKDIDTCIDTDKDNSVRQISRYSFHHRLNRNIRFDSEARNMKRTRNFSFPNTYHASLFIPSSTSYRRKPAPKYKACQMIHNVAVLLQRATYKCSSKHASCA